MKPQLRASGRRGSQTRAGPRWGGRAKLATGVDVVVFASWPAVSIKRGDVERRRRVVGRWCYAGRARLLDAMEQLSHRVQSTLKCGLWFPGSSRRNIVLPTPLLPRCLPLTALAGAMSGLPLQYFLPCRCPWTSCCASPNWCSSLLRRCSQPPGYCLEGIEGPSFAFLNLLSSQQK